MSRVTSFTRSAKAIVALFAIPFIALMCAAVLVSALEGDANDCTWCDWVMGAAGLAGLVAGMRVAATIWSEEQTTADISGPEQVKTTEQTAQRTHLLVAGWFWTGIVGALIFVPALVQGRWTLAILAIPIGGSMWFALWWSARHR